MCVQMLLTIVGDVSFMLHRVAADLDYPEKSHEDLFAVFLSDFSCFSVSFSLCKYFAVGETRSPNCAKV